MKTSILILLIFCLAAAVTAAPQHHAPSQIQRMVGQLDLSADQKAKIDPILDEDASRCVRSAAILPPTLCRRKRTSARRPTQR